MSEKIEAAARELLKRNYRTLCEAEVIDLLRKHFAPSASSTELDDPTGDYCGPWRQEYVEQLRELVERIEKMLTGSGTPDLFWPEGGWDGWLEDAQGVLVNPPPAPSAPAASETKDRLTKDDPEDWYECQTPKAPGARYVIWWSGAGIRLYPTGDIILWSQDYTNFRRLVPASTTATLREQLVEAKQFRDTMLANLNRDLNSDWSRGWDDASAQAADIVSWVKGLRSLWHESEAVITSLREQLAAAEKFKAWTHSYLDGKGVPHDPDPEGNAKHGCRISGRMQWVFEQLEQARRDLAESRAEWSCMARACGNWREWPKGAVSEDAPDYTHSDWQAAARAMIERDAAEATVTRLQAALAASEQRADELELAKVIIRSILSLDWLRKQCEAEWICLLNGDFGFDDKTIPLLSAVEAALNLVPDAWPERHTPPATEALAGLVPPAGEGTKS